MLVWSHHHTRKFFIYNSVSYNLKLKKISRFWLGAVAHAGNPAFRRPRQKDQEVKASFNYKMSLRPVWAL